jgi:hypothetical protein
LPDLNNYKFKTKIPGNSNKNLSQTFGQYIDKNSTEKNGKYWRGKLKSQESKYKGLTEKCEIKTAFCW